MVEEEDDDDDEEVLWCSGCTGGRSGCSQCVRSSNGGGGGEQQRSSTSFSRSRSRNKNKVENNTCESEEQMLSGLPSSSTSDGDNCCPCPCPFPRSQSLAFENIPMTSIGGRETSTSATSGTNNARHELLGCSRKQPYPHQGGLSSARIRRHPLIPSKTIVVPPTSSSSLENLISLANKATSIACLHDARIICREKILASVPNKLSSTGVRILYLCDATTRETEKTGTYTHIQYNIYLKTKC